MARTLRQTMTDAETILWRELRARRVGVQFRRQHATARFVLDFYAPGPRLAIEVDGPIHDAQRARDVDRDAWLATVGVRTLRFTNDAAINDLAAVLARISAALEPGSSLPEGEIL